MRDKFLERLELLEQSLAELKSEYLRAGEPPPEPEKNVIKITQEKAVPPKSVPPLPPVPAPAEDMKTIQIKAPTFHPNPDSPPPPKEKVIKMDPAKSSPPKVSPPSLPPAPEHDLRTIQVKAPPLKPVTEEEEEKSPVFKFPLEWFVGRRLFGTLGMILVLVGICFGVVYAYQNFNLSPQLRVGAACIFSMLISGSGFFLRHPKYRFLSLLLKGGGLGGLYISIYGGYNIYNFFGPHLTGGALAAVALLIFALSWFERSQVAGVFATIGAFMMPLLINSNPNHEFFCFYMLCVNLPVMFLGLKRKWQLLYNLSFILSLVIGLGWMNIYTRNHENTILLFWSLFTVEYLVLALLKLRGETDFSHRLFDFGRIIFLFFLGLAVVYAFDYMLEVSCWLLMGAFIYGGAAGGAWLVNKKMYGEFILLLGAAAAFLALAAMEAFTDRVEVYLCWAIEALAMGVFAFFARSRAINRLATAMAAAAWVLIHIDYLSAGRVFMHSLFFNHVNVLGKIGLLLLLIQGALGIWRFEKSLGSKIVAIAASFGLIAITSYNAGCYFESREPWLLFTAFPLAVASLIFCWAAHLSPRYGFLKPASILWFGWMILTVLQPGAGVDAAWQLLLWAPGALALYWLLPRGNLFRPFASMICAGAVLKCFYFQNQAGVLGFFNIPFLIALFSGAIFLALNWTPPWLRDKGENPPKRYSPHYISWGVLGMAVIFCVNIDYHFSRLDALLPWAASLMAGCCVLAALARGAKNRIFALYSMLPMFCVLVIGCYDMAGVGFAGGAFMADRFYIWLGLLAACWSVLKLSDTVLGGKELVLMRLFSGSLFIFIIYREFGRLPDPSLANALSLIFLTVAAVLICGWGLRKRRPAARYYSFVLLAIAVFQLIVQSLFQLKDPARILAFIALGLLLLGLSFIYHKVSEFIDARDRAAKENDGKN